MEGFFKEETEEFGDFGGAFAFLVEGAEEVGPFVERRSGIEQAGAGEGVVEQCKRQRRMTEVARIDQRSTAARVVLAE